MRNASTHHGLEPTKQAAARYPDRGLADVCLRPRAHAPAENTKSMHSLVPMQASSLIGIHFPSM